MEMIAMLGGLGQMRTTSAGAEADQKILEVTNRIKRMDSETLLGLAQAAMSGQGYREDRASQIAAVAPQIYAEVVSRFGVGKLVELSGRADVAAAAAVQAHTAKAADRMSPLVAGSIGLVIGAVAMRWLIKG